ncbi:MAG: hypothetical protein Q8O23_01590 [Gallionella sp.]|nr:hypothetical protein [Gallionella sp.]
MPSVTAAAPAPPPPRHCAGQRKDRSPACGLQAATSSHPAPRRHAVKLRHGFISPTIAVPSSPTFTLGQHEHGLPAACVVGDETAHGFSGYAGVPLTVPYFVARRRLTALKRTAAMPVLVRSKGQTQ